MDKILKANNILLNKKNIDFCKKVQKVCIDYWVVNQVISQIN